jgi:acyl CoA:acetate/3-ketoacid CoA transferase beta subunit
MSVADTMACALTREIRDDDVVGVGLGTPLALCACLLARRTSATGPTVLVAGAVSPEATLRDCLGGPAAFAGRTPGFVPHLDTMDMAERQAMTLQFLRPAQVGRDGSANTSRAESGGKLVRLPGGLALADVPNLLPRIVLYHTAHEPRALPRDVGFRTGAGGGIERGGYRALGPTKLITDRCVIKFGPGGPQLESIHAAEEVESVLAATGFPLVVGDSPETPPPTDVELAALQDVDPERLRELEFRSLRAAAEKRRANA